MICGSGGLPLGRDGSGAGNRRLSNSSSTAGESNAGGLVQAIGCATGPTSAGVHRRILRGHTAQTTSGERLLLINYVSPSAASPAMSSSSVVNTTPTTAVIPRTPRPVLHSRVVSTNATHVPPVRVSGLGSEVTVTLTRSIKTSAGHIIRTTQPMAAAEPNEHPTTISTSPPPLVFTHTELQQHDFVEHHEMCQRPHEQQLLATTKNGAYTAPHHTASLLEPLDLQGQQLEQQDYQEQHNHQEMLLDHHPPQRQHHQAQRQQREELFEYEHAEYEAVEEHQLSQISSVQEHHENVGEQIDEVYLN